MSLAFGFSGCNSGGAAAAGANAWPARTLPPALEAGGIHLWAIQTDVPARLRTSLARFLAADELTRAGRLVAALAGARFVAAHGALRLLLGAYTGAAPGALRLGVTSAGKPFLEDARLRFSLSHSAGLTLVAFSEGVELGVDVEQRRTVPDAVALATRYFARDEARSLAALPANKQSDAFLRCWTSKEAAMKLTGEGFARPLDSIRVSVERTAPPRLLEVVGLPGAVGEWSLHSLEPAAGYLAALVAAAASSRVRCFTLGVEGLLGASRALVDRAVVG